MKKIISGFVVLGVLSTCLLPYAAPTNITAKKASYKVMVRGEEYISVPPAITIDGSTYLPLRAMGNVLGVSVVWNKEKKQAEVGMTTISNDDTNTQTELTEAEKKIWGMKSWKATKASFKVLVRGKVFEPKNPPLVVGNRTYLPLRVLGDALGVKVDWNKELREAQVDMGTTSATLPQSTVPGAVPATSTPTSKPAATITPAATATIAPTPTATTAATATSSSGSSSSSNATAAPTAMPTVTPTLRPIATVTPTPDYDYDYDYDEPTIGPEMTEAPITTPAPTQAATQTPVATQAPAATQAPVATQAPAVTN